MGSVSEIKYNSVEDLQDLYSKLSSVDTATLENITSTTKSLIFVKNVRGNSCISTYYNLLCRIYCRGLDIIKKSTFVLEDLKTLHPDLQVSMVNAILFTDQYKHVDQTKLTELCQNLLDSLTKVSTIYTLMCFRSVNLFYKRYTSAKINFSLSKFYTCLQSQSSAVRDECILFFKNWIESEQNAEEIFITIINYWPWSNKFKYIVVSVILSSRKLENLIYDENDLEIFLQGVRLSLRFKGLFSVGQLVIRCLSKDSSEVLNRFLLSVIKEGSYTELIYLNSQWMHYIKEKEELYELLDLDEDINCILELKFVKNDPFRFVLICTIFEKQLQKSLHLEGVINYMQAKCFDFDLDAQLYVFKFIVNNITATGHFLESSLNFTIGFINMHLFVPSSEFRNTILGKLPLIIDLLSKTAKSAKTAVIAFFTRLKEAFKTGIMHRDYQPLIFNLKLFEILLRCCRSTSHKSLMKNSHVELHHTLANMLVEENVWDFQDEQLVIFNLLSDCGDFEDAREMIVNILITLESKNSTKGFELWKELVEDSSIEKCALSLYYARLSFHWNKLDMGFLQTYFHYCIDKIIIYSEEIEIDALNACKHGHHIYGYFNALNEFFKFNINEINCRKVHQREATDVAEKAVQLVLNKLNVASFEETNASFQIMDESLEMLVSESSWTSDIHAVDRKYLLLSFWMTLKACCEIATSVGIKIVKQSECDSEARELLKRCIQIHSTILHGCRHKGAIEAAGTSLGQLVKAISSFHGIETETYKILYGCFDILFGSVNNISTTRRGAGLSIMFHHFIKNDAQKSRPLFQHAIKILLEHVQKSRSPGHNPKELDEHHDNFEALVLHYLCVLVRDSELKESISEYYDDIMMSAITRITDKEWTIRNGALQLFGALVPKIVGQKQATLGESEKSSWEPCEMTFTEFCIKLPKTNVHIMNYCKQLNKGRKSTSSIILFLEFLSSIDYIKKGENDSDNLVLIEFREILWRFLSHHHEKVRKLSSKCLARFHDFHIELPELVLRTIDLIFSSNNENFIHGLILFYIHALHKLKVEAQFISRYNYNDFCKDFRKTLIYSCKKKSFSSYIRRYLLELFKLVKCDFQSEFVKDMLEYGVRPQMNRRANYLNFGIDDILHEKLGKWGK